MSPRSRRQKRETGKEFNQPRSIREVLDHAASFLQVTEGRDIYLPDPVPYWSRGQSLHSPTVPTKVLSENFQFGRKP